MAAVLLLSASAVLAADMLKMQGESMTLATGISTLNDSSAEPTGAGKSIRYTASATARKNVTYTKGATQIVVRARKDGTNANHPLLKVFTKTGTQSPVLRGTATVSSTSYQEYTFPFSANSGTHQVQVRGDNIASGRLLRVDYFRIPETAPTVDTTPPETTITSGPGDTSDGTADFAFSSNESGSTFECRLVGYETTRKACTNPKSYSGLVTGTSYTLKAWAIDAAGNPDGSPATSTFSVQTLPSLPNHKAVGAERFTDFTAVGTHFAYSDTGYASGFADLKRALCDMDGVEHIRDRAILYGDPRDAEVYGRYKELFQDCGIRTTLVVDIRSETLNPITPQKIDQMLTFGGAAIEGWEGPNEYNNTNKGGNNPDWATELARFQQDLFAAVNASQQPDIPVLCPSINHKVDGAYVKFSDVSDMGAYCDVNNIHSYPGGNPPTWGPPGIDERESNLHTYNYPLGDHVGDPRYDTYVTESGYQHSITVPGGNGVPEDIMGEYLPMQWAEYFNASFDPNYPGTSVARTYIHQLYDNRTEDSYQANFGMIETDFRRKAHYRSLENMLDIVADPAANAGTFVPGSLGYDITGESAQVHTILLQKADAKFYLLMWQEDRRYDWRDQYERYITVAAENVTIDFQGTPDVKVYSPVDIAWSSGASALSSPSRTLVDAGSVTEPINTKMKVFEITP